MCSNNELVIGRRLPPGGMISRPVYGGDWGRDYGSWGALASMARNAQRWAATMSSTVSTQAAYLYQPQKPEDQCKSPAVQAALNHPDYKGMVRDAWRMSRNRGNIEAGFNFGSYLFGGRGFGDVYPGRDNNTIIFRDDIDSLFAGGIWSPDVHFHIHPAGEDPNTSPFDGNFARNTSAIVVAISPKGMDCTNGRR